MLSKNKIKFIQSLEQKKFRKESGCFLAEGNKWVEDTLSSFQCETLLATAEWLAAHPVVSAGEVLEVTREELKKASLLKTPQEVIAIYKIPEYRPEPDLLRTQLVLALDTVQDPGNLGTIVRLADWYGIEHVICSPECADVYNPKVVQATMGALARVKVYSQDLAEFLASFSEMPIYGTFLNGKNLYDQELSKSGILIMGSEGNGISPSLEKYINKRLYIPNYPSDRSTTESLNVAVATAIVCAEFRRRC